MRYAFLKIALVLFILMAIAGYFTVAEYPEIEIKNWLRLPELFFVTIKGKLGL